MRKEAGLALDDRITITYEADGGADGERPALAALRTFAEYIQRETLAVSLTPGEPNGADAQETVAVGDERIRISLRRVS
jgi:hypothetical protein